MRRWKVTTAAATPFASRAANALRDLPVQSLASATPYFLGGIMSVIDPSAISAVKKTVSESVGCGWIVRPMSSASAPISSASTVSAMSSPGVHADDVRAEDLLRVLRRRAPW